MAACIYLMNMWLKSTWWYYVRHILTSQPPSHALITVNDEHIVITNLRIFYILNMTILAQ